MLVAFIVGNAITGTVSAASANDATAYTILDKQFISAFTLPERIGKIDTRGARLDAYFAARRMPLEGHGQTFVEEADRAGIDWRLVAAIGVRESSGGKYLMNNNPFGWGSAKIPFEDFDHAIVVVTSHLAGENPHTARYYANNTTFDKLWAYNGTVLHTYPAEVMAIMDMF